MTTLEAIRAALPAYPIEVPFPDIARWREGNTGVDYLHTFDSGKPGKHVMILALTHGNEVSGAIAVDTALNAPKVPTTVNQVNKMEVRHQGVEKYSSAQGEQ